LRAASSGALDKAVRAHAKRALQHDLALDKTI
jgi:hypothetical protein